MNKNYKISMYYDDYIIHYESITAYELQNIDNSIVFYTNKETIDYLNLNDVKYIIEKNIKENIKKFLFYKKYVLLMLIVIIFCAYMNTYRVKEISFNIETPINNIIEEEIQVYYKKVFVFNFCKENYEDLARDLRVRYSCYEWISINKNYDVIEVEIIKTGLDIEISDNLNGNIVATKDGIVDSYLVHSGSVLIQKNDYVKTGDILIEGKYSATTVSPKGVVLANTFIEESYKVYKVNNETILTGNINTFFGISLFNNDFNFKKDFEYSNYDTTKTVVFRIPFLFDIYKIQHLEKKDVSYENDKESAIEYGYTLVEENFNKKKVIEEEMIVSTNYLSCTEKEEYFEVVYLVKKIESIGEFVSDN